MGWTTWPAAAAGGVHWVRRDVPNPRWAWGNLYREGARFTVVGVADPVEALAAGRAATAAAWQGDIPAVHADWARMIEVCRPAAVDVCTPHHLHHVVARGCLAAGVGGIVEKPLAVTLRAACQLLAASELTGRILAAMAARRADPHHRSGRAGGALAPPAGRSGEGGIACGRSGARLAAKAREPRRVVAARRSGIHRLRFDDSRQDIGGSLPRDAHRLAD